MITHWLHRISIGQKLLLLGFLVLATISVPLYLQLRQSQELIAAAVGEREGVAPARLLMRLVQLTQQHRGLSAAWLGGNLALQTAREHKNAEVNGVLAQLDAVLKQAGLADNAATAWRQGHDEWQALERGIAARSLSAAASSEQHAQVIRRQLKVVELLLDQSGLILDPETPTYHLMFASLVTLPATAEALGQTRARGAGFLAEGHVMPEHRAALAGLTKQARDLEESMANSFGKAFDADADMKIQLADKLTGVAAPIETALNLAQKEVILADNPTLAAKDYLAAFTQAIDALFTLNNAALDVLEQTLTARVGSLRSTQYVQFGLLGMLFLGIAVLATLVARSITRPLQHAVHLAERIAQGDLTAETSARGRDEIAQLLNALKTMRNSLHRIVGAVRDNAEGVNTASRDIARDAADLSQSVDQHAAALEQTASSMEQMTGTVKLNADHANDANRLAQQARELALHGGESVEQMVQTMKGIDASSRRIADIIGVIDGIAFQTNLLALNAAVEAARAGDQGRGFAVVANEVRNLAQRSAGAAKEIKTLIADSVEQVNGGSRVVLEAGSTMKKTVESIREVADSIAQITHASAEQTQGLSQINHTITHMDRLTQRNASLARQSADAARQLCGRADRLSTLVNTFQLAHEPAAAAPVEAQPEAAPTLPWVAARA